MGLPGGRLSGPGPRTLPQLRVVIDCPRWLTGDEDRRLRERMTIDIDNTDNAFLAALIQQRT